MIIQSVNFRLKLEEILEEEPLLPQLTQTEQKVIELIRNWYQSAPVFQHQTSGSTGKPKEIMVPKERILISAKATMDFLDPAKTFRTTLLCISPSFIGGAMVVYRALHRKLDLYIMEPDAKPVPPFSISSFDLVSMVPMQFQNLSEEELNRFGSVLIGGGAMPVAKSQSSTRIFSTFGMTETLSHIALRELHESSFKTLPGIKVRAEKDNTLSVSGAITDNNWLNTNDIIDIVSDQEFRWLGRKDFVINSGGIKLHPEAIEDKLKNQFSAPFLLLYKPDPTLGQRLVLVAEETEKKIDFKVLSNYERPKQVLFEFDIPRTASGKLDRRKAQQVLLTC